MHIAIDYTPGIAQAAGIGRYARGLVTALTEIDHTNYYTLFAARANGRKCIQADAMPSAPHITMRLAPVAERWLTRAWHRLRLPLPVDLLAGRADIFHALDFALPPTRMRRVVTIHDLAFLTHPHCSTPELAAYLRRVVPRAARAADRVITVSEHTRDVLLRWLGDLDPRRVVTIPLGVSIPCLSAIDSRQQHDLAMRLGLIAPFILAVGTLEPRKNYPNLLRAFAQARTLPGGPRQLVIVGRRGWRWEPIFATIAALRLGDAVRIVESATDADLAALHAQAAVVAQISFTEGFGLPVIEAMAAGVPVVASTGGALPEVAGDAALLVDPHDPAAIAQALHMASTAATLREHLIARGRTRAAQFTWHATAARTLAVYGDALAQTPRSGRCNR